MADRKLHTLLTYCIAGVWTVNGLFCKVLNLVPRHQQIVAGILGGHHSRAITFFIGLLEIGMAVWILSKINPHVNAIVQIIIVAIMNVIEFALVPDLLLWGRFNVVFALLFIYVVYYNAFLINKRLA